MEHIHIEKVDDHLIEVSFNGSGRKPVGIDYSRRDKLRLVSGEEQLTPTEKSRLLVITNKHLKEEAEKKQKTFSFDKQVERPMYVCI